MVARTTLALVGLSSLLLASGCVVERAPGEHGVARSEQPIINGTPDQTHTAVVAVLGNQSECSGTVFKIDSNNKLAYVLTAGHCVTDPPSPPDPPQDVRVGNDYNAP